MNPVLFDSVDTSTGGWHRVTDGDVSDGVHRDEGGAAAKKLQLTPGKPEKKAKNVSDYDRPAVVDPPRPTEAGNEETSWNSRVKTYDAATGSWSDDAKDYYFAPGTLAPASKSRLEKFMARTDPDGILAPVVFGGGYPLVFKVEEYAKWSTESLAGLLQSIDRNGIFKDTVQEIKEEYAADPVGLQKALAREHEVLMGIIREWLAEEEEYQRGKQGVSGAAEKRFKIRYWKSDEGPTLYSPEGFDTEGEATRWAAKHCRGEWEVLDKTAAAQAHRDKKARRVQGVKVVVDGPGKWHFDRSDLPEDPLPYQFGLKDSQDGCELQWLDEDDYAYHKVRFPDQAAAIKLANALQQEHNSFLNMKMVAALNVERWQDLVDGYLAKGFGMTEAKEKAYEQWSKDRRKTPRPEAVAAAGGSNLGLAVVQAPEGKAYEDQDENLTLGPDGYSPHMDDSQAEISRKIAPRGDDDVLLWHDRKRAGSPEPPAASGIGTEDLVYPLTGGLAPVLFGADEWKEWRGPKQEWIAPQEWVFGPPTLLGRVGTDKPARYLFVTETRGDIRYKVFFQLVRQVKGTQMFAFDDGSVQVMGMEVAPKTPSEVLQVAVRLQAPSVFNSKASAALAGAKDVLQRAANIAVRS